MKLTHILYEAVEEFNRVLAKGKLKPQEYNGMLYTILRRNLPYEASSKIGVHHILVTINEGQAYSVEFRIPRGYMGWEDDPIAEIRGRTFHFGDAYDKSTFNINSIINSIRDYGTTTTAK